MRFEKRTAIITGAGAGIGKSAAIGFAREGAVVYITDINETTLEATAKEIRSAGGKATAIPGDVTKAETVKSLVGKALEQTGKVDILFNYVGGMPPIPFTRSFLNDGEEVWDAFIELNLKSTLRFTRAVLGSMIFHQISRQRSRPIRHQCELRLPRANCHSHHVKGVRKEPGSPESL
jgi:NAD(P)-dependent dehydrogenase (short-subunit alcohol dehydrogenase family)